MIDGICNFLIKSIRKKMPEIDDERAEVINYGLLLVIGEFPKCIGILLLSHLLGVFKLTFLAFIFVLPYRMFSGGVHLKTHIGCFIATAVSYVGNAFLSKNILFKLSIKYILIFFIWAFSMIMIKLYAPADTEAVPILRKKERTIKRVLSYFTMTLNLIIATIWKNNTYSNLLIFGTLIQTVTITRFIYIITNNKYGYEEYQKQVGVKG